MNILDKTTEPKEVATIYLTTRTRRGFVGRMVFEFKCSTSDAEQLWEIIDAAIDRNEEHEQTWNLWK